MALYERGRKSFGRRPISNKIPSPKELVYPDELFYYPLFYAGSRDFRKNSQTSKKERNSVLVPNLVPNDVKKHVGILEKSMDIENIKMHKKLQSSEEKRICNITEL